MPDPSTPEVSQGCVSRAPSYTQWRPNLTILLLGFFLFSLSGRTGSSCQQRMESSTALPCVEVLAFVQEPCELLAPRFKALLFCA